MELKKFERLKSFLSDDVIPVQTSAIWKVMQNRGSAVKRECYDRTWFCSVNWPQAETFSPIKSGKSDDVIIWHQWKKYS